MAAPSIILDSGALIAIERGERSVGALLTAAAEEGVQGVTSSACVAQVWRDPVRQTRLARALKGLVEFDLDKAGARRCGVLLGLSGTSDIADAALSLLVNNGDTVLTGDPRDIRHLLDVTGTRASVRAV